MLYYKEDHMALKKILLKNGLVTDLKILDVLMEYKNEATEVSTIIDKLVKLLDSEIIEEYEEKVQDGTIQEFVVGQQGKRRVIDSDSEDEVSVLIPKKELMYLFEKARAIEACVKMYETLFMTSQNALIKYLKEYERDECLKAYIRGLKEKLENEQGKNNNICRELEQKEMEITELQRLSNGIEKEYLNLVKEYNDNSKQLKRLKQEVKKVKEKAIKSKEVIRIYEQDKRFQKAHDRYPDDQLYRLVIEAILPYVQDKRLPSQKIINELKKNDMIQDFLRTKKFKLDTATNLTNLYDISIQLVGEEYGLTINDIRSKQTRKRLIKVGKLKEEGELT